MNTKDVLINLAKNQDQGNSFSFTLAYNGFVGLFNICFYDNSRKNSAYRSLRVADIYFDQTISATRRAKLSDVTDAMLFVERNSQWILEHLKQKSNA